VEHHGEFMGLNPQTLSRSVERMGLGYIRPRHNEIARRLVCGQTSSEIGRSLGINLGRLSIIVNSPLFKLEVARLSKLRDDSTIDIQTELRELAPIALGEIAKISMSSPSEKLRLAASQDLLDRAGVIRKGQGINLGVQVNINPIDLNKYKVETVYLTDGGTVHEMNTGTEIEADEAIVVEESDLELLDKLLEMEPELVNG